MKYTLLITQHCNLACDYCYIGKHPTHMTLEVGGQIVDFAFRNTPHDEIVEFGFFGGEPLLEFELLRGIVQLIEEHPDYDGERVRMTVVSNGTIFSARLAAFLNAHGVGFGISCDGPPEVQDSHRRTRTGRATSWMVERTIHSAVAALPALMVNAVYGPDTLSMLPKTVAYLSGLGVRHIYVNPDFTAQWTATHAAMLPAIYGDVGELYCKYHLAGDPHFISLIDTKVAVILRGGYRPLERCRMGCGEYAFTPDGSIYPCERLVGEGTDEHRIGHITRGIDADLVRRRPLLEHASNPECVACGLRAYCMSWCGCSNYFMTGRYDRVGPFLCASEQAAITTAMLVTERLDHTGAWYEHLSGRADTISLPRSTLKEVSP